MGKHKMEVKNEKDLRVGVKLEFGGILSSIIKRPPGRLPRSAISAALKVGYYTLKFWINHIFLLIGTLFLISAYRADQLVAGIFLVITLSFIYLLQRRN
jgi:hypothetical protein